MFLTFWQHAIRYSKVLLTKPFANNMNFMIYLKTMQPFLSDKSHSCGGSSIILRAANALITDPAHVADVFNTYYASIAEYEFMSDGLDSLTLDEAVQKHKDHRSIHLIRNRVSVTDEFPFSFITPDLFSKYVSKLQNSKAVGHDGLKASFLKLSGSRLNSSLCDLFNTCVTASFFPRIWSSRR